MTFEAALPLILLAAVFYLLIIRPMMARQKQLNAVRQMQSSLQPGGTVMLTSGIYGTLVAIDEDQIELEIAPGTVITVAKGAVAETTDTPEVSDTPDPDAQDQP